MYIHAISNLPVFTPFSLLLLKCKTDAFLYCPQVEAKDNVRFLSTLEKHFKTITYSKDLPSVTETYKAMMHALRMVWIISRHYNSDERMVGAAMNANPASHTPLISE